MSKESEPAMIWDYNRAEELINLCIKMFAANPKTKHVVVPSPYGVFSHEEYWTMNNYKLRVYYQNPYDIDDLVISWAKLTKKKWGRNEEILAELNCVYNTNHEKMQVSLGNSFFERFIIPS